MRKYSVILEIAVRGSLLATSMVLPGVVYAAAKVDIAPEVRSEVQWYWQEPNAKCVAVPTHDLASRIAPKILRENKITSEKAVCKLGIGERRIEANLECDGKNLQTFYLKEDLCLAKLNSASVKSK